MPTNCPTPPASAPPLQAAPAWAIVGATASGKTGLAMALARACEGQIIACDSVQVYRGFDIGSAKATRQDRRRVPHHLIDVAAPGAPFDAQIYCQLAEQALDALKAQGRQAIVCGGTGLYLRALRYGLAPTVSADPEFRRTHMAQESLSPGTLYAALQHVDPQSAETIGPYNLVQLLRALEITTLAKEPASRIRARHRAERRARPMRLIELVWPAAILRRRIEARVDAMLGAGLIEEVERLLKQGVSADCRPMRSVGYREVCAYVQGLVPREKLAASMVKSSWAYARRQRTWLRQEAGVDRLMMQGDDSDLQRAQRLLEACPEATVPTA